MSALHLFHLERKNHHLYLDYSSLNVPPAFSALAVFSLSITLRGSRLARSGQKNLNRLIHRVRVQSYRCFLMIEPCNYTAVSDAKVQPNYRFPLFLDQAKIICYIDKCIDSLSNYQKYKS